MCTFKEYTFKNLWPLVYRAWPYPISPFFQFTPLKELLLETFQILFFLEIQKKIKKQKNVTIPSLQ